MTELPDFDPRTLRISKAPFGVGILLAECLRRGCGWQASFSTGRVDIIIDTAAQHACKAYEPPADPNEDPELRTAICDWLRDNGIDPALVPASEKPDCSYRDGDGDGTPIGGHTITTRIHIRCAPDSKAVIVRHGTNRVEETTVTKPMKVPPPAIVQAWLAARCPTCGR